MLLTKRIEGVVNTVEQLNEFSAGVLLHDLIEAFDVDEDHCDLTLSFREILLAVLDSRANE